MNTLYKTTTEVTPTTTGGFVLCHFSHAEDLLFGIDALKSFHIPIQEVHAPVHIQGLTAKLEMKRLKAGYAMLTYGCFGGITATSIIGYALDHHGKVSPLVLLLVGLAFFLASWVITVKPPKLIKLPPNDRRFLIVIQTNHIMPTEGLASFLQYSGSVEITQAVKKMLLN